MFGDINKWQSKLDQIATKYDTDDEEGLHHIFKGNKKICFFPSRCTGIT
jgi:hypothetical protein